MSAGRSPRRPDLLSGILGFELLEEGPGRARVRGEVGEEHRNDLGGGHGGYVFSLADTALAVASNSHGPDAMAIAASIHFLRPARVGDELVAEAREVSLARTTATYEVTVTADNEPVALFTGTVSRRG